MSKICAVLLFVCGLAVANGQLMSWLPGISFPGTNWCGPGDTARNFDDLGYYRREDMCCRAHDHCDYIASGASKNGLTNSGRYTM
jgi:Phospholipase A2